MEQTTYPLLLKVTSVQRIEPEAILLTLSAQYEIEVKAGRFINLLVPINQKTLNRSYSLLNPTEITKELNLLIRVVSNGEVSRYLYQHLEVGMEILATLPKGKFLLPEQISAESNFIFFAAGSGIAPIIGLIKTVLHKTNQHVSLLYSSSSSQKIFLKDDLNFLKKEFGNRFQITHFLSDGDYQDPNKERRLNAFELEKKLKQLVNEHTLVYVCGPHAYMRTIKMVYNFLGFKRTQFFLEHFASEGLLINQQNLSVKHQAAQNCEAKYFSTINVQTSFKIIKGETVLEAARNSEVRLPYSCNAGICGSCTAFLLSGDVVTSTDEVLLPEERSAGQFLTCTSYPKSEEISFTLKNESNWF